MTSPNLLWREGQPTSTEFNDVYFSADNGLEETRYVFLKHNQLAERWQTLNKAADKTGVFTIGETGFGTGLNFLAAWDLWKKSGLDAVKERVQLHFISVEKFPLSRSDLTRALSLWPELKHLSQLLINTYPNFLYRGFHRLDFGSVKLTLIIDDAASGFQQLLQPIETPSLNTTSQNRGISFSPFGLSANPHHIGQGIDAWFLDGFAPAKNPSMWSKDVFEAIGRLSAPHSTAATFTCARKAKDALTIAGFHFKKAPGFGRKREMLFAQHQNSLTSPNKSIKVDSAKGRREQGISPWSQLPVVSSPNKSIAIIGAGLAGCHTAYAFAQRGWKVTVFDRRKKVADGASGNLQGALFLRLSPEAETLAEFNLNAFLFAERFYRPFWHSAKENFGQACGLLQLAFSDKQARLQQRILESYANRADTHELFTAVDASKASEIAGLALNKAGLFFPNSGWLSPQKVCNHLITHPNISVKLSTHCDKLVQTDANEKWTLKNDQGELIHQADVVVIACAHETQRFQQTQHLATKPIRGQVSHLRSRSGSEPIVTSALQTVLTAEGYLTPRCHQIDGIQSLGATFDIGQTEEVVSQVSHKKNIELLQGFGIDTSDSKRVFPQLNHLNPQCDGRTRVRCSSPDYLPIIGPAPIDKQFTEQYRDWHKNAKFSIPTAGAYYSGLYVNVGHGSRGLTYTPIAAELLAAMIHGEPNPVGSSLSDALSAGRFLVRDIKRRKC